MKATLAISENIMQTYNILLSADINYIPYAFVSCQSLVNSLNPRYSDSKDTIVFNLIIDETVDIDFLQNKCDAFKNRNQVAFVSVEFNLISVSSQSFDGAPKFGENTLSAYYRLLVGKVLGDNVHTVLYLDCDTLVRRDIRHLFDETSLDGFVLAGVIDHGLEHDRVDSQKSIIVTSKCAQKSNLEISVNNYINSGVLLINTDEYRKQHILDKCLNIIKNYNIVAHDQDLLNLIVKDKVILPLTWNFMTFSYFHRFSKTSCTFSLQPRSKDKSDCSFQNYVPPHDVFISYAKDPSICHFTKFKPWGKSNCDFKFIPFNNSLSAILREWYATAKTVEEFKKELQALEYCQFNNFDISTCLLNERLESTATILSQQVYRRRRDRKLLLTLIIVLLFLQVFTLTLLFIN